MLIQGRSGQLSQLAVIRALVKLVCEVHQITSVLICPRTSPGAETLEDDSISTLIVRQQTFLQLFVPAGIDVQLLQGKRVSAYDGSYIKLVEQKLKAMSVSGNVLLLSVSLDRMTRSETGPAKLTELLGRAGHRHIAMAMLWDHETILHPIEALQLGPSHEHHSAVQKWWQDSIWEQLRAPAASSLTLPTIQPVVWSFADYSSAVPIAPHVERHVSKAEMFVLSLRTSSFQGERDLALPQELRREDEGKGLTPARAMEWENFLASQVGLPTDQVKVVYANGKTSWACTCSLQASHSQDCQCRCAFCDGCRACPCNGGACDCPLICNCSCKGCHVKVSYPCMAPIQAVANTTVRLLERYWCSSRELILSSKFRG